MPPKAGAGSGNRDDSPRTADTSPPAPLQGMGWGHMPKYLIDQDIHDKRLLSITGRHLKGGQVDVVAARRREAPHGPIANRLWSHIEEQAPAFVQAIH
jgi:DNA-binding transcriptional LysR family regulator